MPIRVSSALIRLMLIGKSCTMANVTIRKVAEPLNFRSGDMRVFMEFPWTVYKNDPNWVPPLVSLRRNLLNISKNPAWEYLEGNYYIAWRGDQPIGTIAAFINKRHNEIWHEQLGWFGWFECLDDQEAATALLKQALEYVQSRGVTAMRGPANFTTNDECALLIENFSPPVLLMPYNLPYYQKLIENSGLGLAKIMDLESWYTTRENLAGRDKDVISQKLTRIVEKTKTKYGIMVRRPTLGTLKKDLKALQGVFSSAWIRNWGAIPPSDVEVDHLFADLKDYYDPSLACFAEINGELVAFLLGLPDLNQALIKSRPHPRVPELITLVRTLWFWKIIPALTGRHIVNRQRVLLFGIKPEHRLKGVDAVILNDMFDILSHHKVYRESDAGWFLETNQPMLSILKAMQLVEYKRYRFYQCPLPSTS